MAIKYNGANVNSIKFNGATVKEFKYNGTVCWERGYTYHTGNLPEGVASFTCTRVSSLQPGVSGGTINDGDTIYNKDTLYFTATAAVGYEAPTWDYKSASDTYTVTGNTNGVTVSNLAAGEKILVKVTLTINTGIESIIYNLNDSRWQPTSSTKELEVYYGSNLAWYAVPETGYALNTGVPSSEETAAVFSNITTPQEASPTATKLWTLTAAIVNPAYLSAWKVQDDTHASGTIERATGTETSASSTVYNGDSLVASCVKADSTATAWVNNLTTPVFVDRTSTSVTVNNTTGYACVIYYKKSTDSEWTGAGYVGTGANKKITNLSKNTEYDFRWYNDTNGKTRTRTDYSATKTWTTKTVNNNVTITFTGEALDPVQEYAAGYSGVLNITTLQTYTVTFTTSSGTSGFSSGNWSSATALTVDAGTPWLLADNVLTIGTETRTYSKGNQQYYNSSYTITSSGKSSLINDDIVFNGRTDYTRATQKISCTVNAHISKITIHYADNEEGTHITTVEKTTSGLVTLGAYQGYFCSWEATAEAGYTPVPASGSQIVSDTTIVIAPTTSRNYSTITFTNPTYGSWNSTDSATAYSGDILQKSNGVITCKKWEDGTTRWTRTCTEPSDTAEWKYSGVSINGYIYGEPQITFPYTIPNIPAPTIDIIATDSRSKKTYTVTINPINCTSNIPSGTYEYGTVIEFTADTGYAYNNDPVTQIDEQTITGAGTYTSSPNYAYIEVRCAHCNIYEGIASGWYIIGTEQSTTFKVTEPTKYSFDSPELLYTDTITKIIDGPDLWWGEPAYVCATFSAVNCSMAEGRVSGKYYAPQDVTFNANQNYAFDNSGTTSVSKSWSAGADLGTISPGFGYVTVAEDGRTTRTDQGTGWYSLGANYKTTWTIIDTAQYTFNSSTTTSTTSKETTWTAAAGLNVAHPALYIRSYVITIKTVNCDCDKTSGTYNYNTKLTFTRNPVGYAYDDSGRITEEQFVTGAGTYSSSPNYVYLALAPTNCSRDSGSIENWYEKGSNVSTKFIADTNYSYSTPNRTQYETLSISNIQSPATFTSRPKYVSATYTAVNCSTTRESGKYYLPDTITFTADPDYAFKADGTTTVEKDWTAGATIGTVSPGYGYVTVNSDARTTKSGNDSGWYSIGSSKSTTWTITDTAQYTFNSTKTTSTTSKTVSWTAAAGSTVSVPTIYTRQYTVTMSGFHCTPTVGGVETYSGTFDYNTPITFTAHSNYAYNEAATQLTDVQYITSAKEYSSSVTHMAATVSGSYCTWSPKSSSGYYEIGTRITWTADANHSFAGYEVSDTSWENVSAGTFSYDNTPYYVKCSISGTHCSADYTTGSILPNNTKITWTADEGTNYCYSFSNEALVDSEAAYVSLATTSYSKTASYIYYNVTISKTNCTANYSSGYILNGTTVTFTANTGTNLKYSFSNENPASPQTTLGIKVSTAGQTLTGNAAYTYYNVTISGTRCSANYSSGYILNGTTITWTAGTTTNTKYSFYTTSTTTPNTTDTAKVSSAGQSLSKSADYYFYNVTVSPATNCTADYSSGYIKNGTTITFTTTAATSSVRYSFSTTSSTSYTTTGKVSSAGQTISSGTVYIWRLCTVGAKYQSTVLASQKVWMRDGTSLDSSAYYNDSTFDYNVQYYYTGKTTYNIIVSSVDTSVYTTYSTQNIHKYNVTVGIQYGSTVLTSRVVEVNYGTTVNSASYYNEDTYDYNYQYYYTGKTTNSTTCYGTGYSCYTTYSTQNDKYYTVTYRSVYAGSEIDYVTYPTIIHDTVVNAVDSYDPDGHDTTAYYYENGTSDGDKTVKGNTTCTMTYAKRTVNKYKVTIGVSPSTYGSVSPTTVSNVPWGTVLTNSGATLNVNGTSVTATPASATAQYTYSFSSWTNGTATVQGNTSVTANFTRSVNNYYLDLNPKVKTVDLDGNSTSSYSSGYTGLTFNLYLNGSTTPTASSVTDYYTQHPYGTTYKFVNNATPTETGYTWTAAADNSGTITGAVSAEPVATKTRKTYTISFGFDSGDPQYGYWDASSKTVNYGDKVTRSGNTVTCYKYTDGTTVRWTNTLHANTTTYQYTFEATATGNSISSVTANGSFGATTSRNDRYYTVTCIDYVGSTSGAELGSRSVSKIHDAAYNYTDFGATAIYNTAQWSYNYSSGSGSGNVTGNVTVYNYFSQDENTYTITLSKGTYGAWYNYSSGAEISSLTGIPYSSTFSITNNTIDVSNSHRAYYDNYTPTGYRASVTYSPSSGTVETGKTITPTVTLERIKWTATVTKGTGVSTYKYKIDSGSWVTGQTASTISNIDYASTLTVIADGATTGYNIDSATTDTASYSKQSVTVPALSRLAYTYTQSSITGVDSQTCYRALYYDPTNYKTISSGATIYYGDRLYWKATAATGYNAPTVSKDSSSNYLSVTGNVSSSSYITAGSVKSWTLTAHVNNSDYLKAWSVTDNTHSSGSMTNPTEGATSTIYHFDSLSASATAKDSTYDSWYTNISDPVLSTRAGTSITVRNPNSLRCDLYYGTSTSSMSKYSTIGASSSVVVNYLTSGTTYYFKLYHSTGGEARTRHDYQASSSWTSLTVDGNESITFTGNTTSATEYRAGYSGVLTATTQCKVSFTTSGGGSWPTATAYVDVGTGWSINDLTIYISGNPYTYTPGEQEGYTSSGSVTCSGSTPITGDITVLGTTTYTVNKYNVTYRATYDGAPIATTGPIATNYGTTVNSASYYNSDPYILTNYYYTGKTTHTATVPAYPINVDTTYSTQNTYKIYFTKNTGVGTLMWSNDGGSNYYPRTDSGYFADGESWGKVIYYYALAEDDYTPDANCGSASNPLTITINSTSLSISPTATLKPKLAVPTITAYDEYIEVWNDNSVTATLVYGTYSTTISANTYVSIDMDPGEAYNFYLTASGYRSSDSVYYKHNALCTVTAGEGVKSYTVTYYNSTGSSQGTAVTTTYTRPSYNPVFGVRVGTTFSWTAVAEPGYSLSASSGSITVAASYSQSISITASKTYNWLNVFSGSVAKALSISGTSTSASATYDLKSVLGATTNCKGVCLTAGTRFTGTLTARLPIVSTTFTNGTYSATAGTTGSGVWALTYFNKVTSNGYVQHYVNSASTSGTRSSTLTITNIDAILPSDPNNAIPASVDLSSLAVNGSTTITWYPDSTVVYKNLYARVYAARGNSLYNRKFEFTVYRDSGSTDTGGSLWIWDGGSTATLKYHDDDSAGSSQPKFTTTASDLQAGTIYYYQLSHYADRQTWQKTSGTGVLGTYRLVITRKQ